MASRSLAPVITSRDFWWPISDSLNFKSFKKVLKIKNNNILKIKIIFKNNMSGFLRNDAQSEKIETTIFVSFNVINET